MAPSMKYKVGYEFIIVKVQEHNLHVQPTVPVHTDSRDEVETSMTYKSVKGEENNF
jgi:hypothetical protein